MVEREDMMDIPTTASDDGADDHAWLRQRIKQLEAALSATPATAMAHEPALRENLETCPIGVAILANDDGRRLFVNPALVAMLGSGTLKGVLEGDIKESWTDPSRISAA